MAAPTYIEGVELRKWVKQHLSRILFQTAHDLAVQTKCEIIVKIQDSQNQNDSHYYATQALEAAFCNGGVQRESWDKDVSATNRLFGFNAKSEPDPVALTITNNDCADSSSLNMGSGSDPSSSENCEEDSDLPTVRRHPFGIIPHKQQTRVSTAQDTNTSSVTVQNVNPVVNVSQSQPQGVMPSVVQSSQPSIQITQQNSARAVVQVVPSTSQPQQMNQVRTINAQGTQIQISGGSTGPTTVVPVQQLNQLKQGQVFIMQKVGNTQMLTPVNIQPGPQGNAVAQNVVSPPPRANKKPRQLCMKPTRNEVPSSGSSGGFSGRPFKCGVCYKTFGSVQVLSRHSLTFHELVPNKRFFCDMCGKNYKHPQHLQQHMATHNSTAPYKCSQCHRGFYRMGTLKDHELLHLGMYRYYCPECRKGFMRPSLLQEHINRFHTATVTPSAPMEHSASMVRTNVVPTNVMYAQQQQQEEEDTNNLLQQQDGEDDPANASTETDSDIGNKTSSQDPSQDWQDNLNGITIKQERMSPVPMDDQEDHKEGEQIKTQVQTSDNNQSDQSVSSLAHTGVGAGTSQLPTMVAITTATGEPLTSPEGNPLVKIVPKVVGDYTTLKTSGQAVAPASGGSGSGRPQRRYSCDICGKTYKYVFHMREHRLTHSGQHPFVCKICNTGFFRQRQLREHQFRHSGSFPYSCDKCSKGFFRPSELRRHQSVKHGIVIAGGS